MIRQCVSSSRSKQEEGNEEARHEAQREHQVLFRHAGYLGATVFKGFQRPMDSSRPYAFGSSRPVPYANGAPDGSVPGPSAPASGRTLSDTSWNRTRDDNKIQQEHKEDRDADHEEKPKPWRHVHVTVKKDR